MIDLFSSDAVSALANLKELLFAPAAGGLFWLIMRMRNSRVVEESADAEGSVRLTLSDGTSISVPSKTLRLYRSVTIRQRAQMSSSLSATRASTRCMSGPPQIVRRLSRWGPPTFHRSMSSRNRNHCSTRS